jgi:hypothetical protein
MMERPEFTPDAPGPFVEYLDGLGVEERNDELGGLDEEARTRLIEGLPLDQRMRWINEEREHLEQIGARQVQEGGVEGAELGEAVEEVTIPGNEDGPQDRAPDVGAETIAQLVNERLAAERRAVAAERLAEESAAELDAYYKAFGPLPS